MVQRVSTGETVHVVIKAATYPQDVRPQTKRIDELLFGYEPNASMKKNEATTP